MKTITLRAYNGKTVVGTLIIGEFPGDRNTVGIVGSIHFKPKGCQKWMSWHEDGWYKVGGWDRLEIIDAK